VRRTLFAILSVTVLLGCLPFSSADDGLPTVKIMQAGADRLSDDIKFVMELSGSRGVKQWPNVRDVLPAFLGGVDGKKPMRIDVIFGEKREYRLSIPVADWKDFHANVAGFVGAKGRKIKTGLYFYRGAAYTGYLRELTKIGYAAISEDQAKVPADLLPLVEIQALIDAGYDLAATVTNTEMGADARRKAIVDLQKEALDSLKKLPGESDEDLEIRRVGIVHQMQELERLFADSKELTLGWTTDAEKKEGRLNLELVALENSDLEKSIQQLGMKPSLFSGIKRGEQTTFFGHINHPLDEMRQKHLTEMLGLLEARAIAEIAVNDLVAAENKDATTTATKQFFKMLHAGTAMGVFDGFVDVTEADGARNVAGGIRAADGHAAVEVLASLKAAGWDVEIDIVQAPVAPAETGTEATDKDAENADATPADDDKAPADAVTDAKPAAVRFHRVTIPKAGQADFTQLFGADSVMHVATTSDAIYYASGSNGLERVKASMAAAAGATPADDDGTFLETWAKLGPWIDYLKGRRERREADLDLSKLTKEEKAEREERIEMRDSAISAFAKGQDAIHMKLQRKDQKVTGLTVFGEGILRFVGSQIADFSEKTLQ